MDNIKIDTWWEIIDELRRELNIKEDAIVDLNECIDNLKKITSYDSRVHQEYEYKYIYKINKLEEENNKLNELVKATSSHNKELQGLISENKELKIKLNDRVSCKDYESEGREYFHHNPSSNKVSFFMFDNDYIEQYDIDESMEICTIYNDNI